MAYLNDLFKGSDSLDIRLKIIHRDAGFDVKAIRVSDQIEALMPIAAISGKLEATQSSRLIAVFSSGSIIWRLRHSTF